jgi:tripartite ATP-independent transporter DctM subunit
MTSGTLAALERLDKRIQAITGRIAAIGVVGMLVIGIITSIDLLVLRGLLNAPLPGSNEILQTVFAVAIASVMASGFAQRSNLNVDMLQEWFGRRTAAWLEVIGDLLFAALFVLLVWRVGLQALNATVRAQQTVIMQLPLAPFLWAIVGFLALCIPVQLVVFLANLARTLAIPPLGAGGAKDDPAMLVRMPVAAGRFWQTALLLVAAAVVVLMGASIWLERPVAWLVAAPTTVSIVFFALLWVLVLLLIPIAAAMMVIGLVGSAVFIGANKTLNVLGSETVGLMTNPDLALIPLFIMMGNFAKASGLADDIYRLAHATFGFLRGGVAMATVVGCAGFGALTGSSVATAVTIGAAALPEMRRRGYSAELSAGCVAAGGTLGQLVPPSTAIVLYAILVEESIGKLYIAVLIPGLLSILMYMGAIAAYVGLYPSIAPGRDRFDLCEVAHAFWRSATVFLLFAAILGGIYTGLYTATEAAAVGAVFTFLVALYRRKLGRGSLWNVISETTRSVTMIYMMIIGALLISFFMDVTGLPAALTAAIGGSGLPPVAIIYVLVITYIVLGTALDSFTIMIVTAPLVAPLVVHLGYDPIWWGIMMVVLCELGVVSPPFGLNLFILKTLAPDVPISSVFRGVMPFMTADCIKCVILIHFPILALWLPQTMAR